MTDTARVREILDSYGADAARWPDDERDAVAAALAADAGLRAVRAEAVTLDALLGEWATRDLGRGDAAAAAARVLRPAMPWRRWLAGGGIAAAVAGAMLLGQPRLTPPAAPVASVAAAALTEEAAFTELFTATPDEESLL